MGNVMGSMVVVLLAVRDSHNVIGMVKKLATRTSEWNAASCQCEKGTALI